VSRGWGGQEGYQRFQGSRRVRPLPLMMPGMDGITVLRKALEIDPGLVGVILTGQGTIPTAVEALLLAPPAAGPPAGDPGLNLCATERRAVQAALLQVHAARAWGSAAAPSTGSSRNTTWRAARRKPRGPRTGRGSDPGPGYQARQTSPAPPGPPPQGESC
jgi:hypothetical protein